MAGDVDWVNRGGVEFDKTKRDKVNDCWNWTLIFWPDCSLDEIATTHTALCVEDAQYPGSSIEKVLVIVLGFIWLY